MITRRNLSLGALCTALVSNVGSSAQTVDPDQLLEEVTYPSFDALDGRRPFGYDPASQEEIDIAEQIVARTVLGPRPIDIAQSFVDRFYREHPNWISQWPYPGHWNPLVVKFFSATSSPPNNDMIPWCAAFANWCIERAGKKGSRSASSQSFVDKKFEKIFEKTTEPREETSQYLPATRLPVKISVSVMLPFSKVEFRTR